MNIAFYGCQIHDIKSLYFQFTKIVKHSFFFFSFE